MTPDDKLRAAKVVERVAKRMRADYSFCWGKDGSQTYKRDHDELRRLAREEVPDAR